MALSLTVKLENRKQIIRMLDLIPKKVNGVLLKAMERAVSPIKRAAESKAPIRKTGKGGTLRDSFTTEANVKPGNIALFLGPGVQAFYGQMQELGTKNHPAQPFLRPAFDEQKNNAARLFGFTVAKAVRDAVRQSGAGAAI